jgi:predicted small secreted protein
MRQLTMIVLLGSSLVACTNRGGGADVDSAESAVDSSDSVGSESDLMAATMDGSEATGLVDLTPEQIAVRISANVAGRWASGCAKATANGTNVTITYTDCTGPRGLVHVTGELDVAISVSGTTITAHATSSDMQINRANLTIDATATYTVSGTTKTLTVATDGSGTGPRGNEIEHQGNYAITWDAATQCRTIDGHWQTDIGARERSNDVSLTRCDGGCPTGTVTHHFLLGASLTITFDGTATATWSTSTGRSGTVTLGCQ